MRQSFDCAISTLLRVLFRLNENREWLSIRTSDWKYPFKRTSTQKLFITQINVYMFRKLICARKFNLLFGWHGMARANHCKFVWKIRMVLKCLARRFNEAIRNAPKTLRSTHQNEMNFQLCKIINCLWMAFGLFELFHNWCNAQGRTSLFDAFYRFQNKFNHLDVRG